MNETPQKRLDHLIDQALRDFPLEPAPEGLKEAVMRRIGEPAPSPRFRISWVDLALSGILAVIIGFALDFLQNVLRSPYWMARLRVSVILFSQDIKLFLMHNQTSLQAGLLSAGTIFLLLAVLASIYWRYAAFSDKLPA